MKKLLVLGLLCITLPATAFAEDAPPQQTASQPTTAPAKRAPTTQSQTPPLYSLDSAAQPTPKTVPTLGRILQSQHLRVCVRSDVPPFGYFSASGLTGFDIGLATEIAVRLSIDYKKNLHIDWTVYPRRVLVSQASNKKPAISCLQLSP